jgi:hypothetical protein
MPSYRINIHLDIPVNPDGTIPPEVNAVIKPLEVAVKNAKRLAVKMEGGTEPTASKHICWHEENGKNPNDTISCQDTWEEL